MNMVIERAKQEFGNRVNFLRETADIMRAAGMETRELAGQMATSLKETADIIADACRDIVEQAEYLKADIEDMDISMRKLAKYSVKLLQADPVAFDALAAAMLLGEIPQTVDAAMEFIAALRDKCGGQKT